MRHGIRPASSQRLFCQPSFIEDLVGVERDPCKILLLEAGACLRGDAGRTVAGTKQSIWGEMVLEAATYIGAFKKAEWKGESEAGL